MNCNKPHLSFTQLLSTPFFTNLLASQSFHLTKDQPHAFQSTPEVDLIPLTQPNEPEFVKFSLPDEELGSFSDDEDRILCNQSHEERDE